MFPLGPGEIVQISTATLNLGSAIAKIIAKAQEEGRHLSAAQIQNALLNTAVDLSKQHIKALRDLKQELMNAGVDLSQPPGKIIEDVRWWRLKQYLAVRQYKRRIEGVTNGLGDLYQDIIAMAHCKEAEDIITKTSIDARSDDRARRQLLTADRPLREILDELIAEAEAVDGQLSAVLARGAGTP